VRRGDLEYHIPYPEDVGELQRFDERRAVDCSVDCIQRRSSVGLPCP